MESSLTGQLLLHPRTGISRSQPTTFSGSKTTLGKIFTASYPEPISLSSL